MSTQHLITVDDFKKEVMVVIEKKVQRHIVPLFKVDRKREPQYSASGFLLDYHGQKFLVTAAHVFWEGSELCIPYDKEIDSLKIKAIKATSKKADSSTNDPEEPYDFAIAEIASESVEKIESSQYRFLPQYFLEKDFVFNDNKILFFYGYPASRVQPKMRWNKLLAQPLYYWGVPERLSDMKGSRYSARIHHFLSFPESEILVRCGKKEGNQASVPCLRGISGSGLWYIKDMLLENPEYRLIGVVIEEAREHKVIVATKIKFVMDVLEQHF